MARGADVVILSDGWDRGASGGAWAIAMERLHRLAHRVIWVNPLKAAPGYAPLAQGMAAALPSIDRVRRGPLAREPRSPRRPARRPATGAIPPTGRRRADGRVGDVKEIMGDLDRWRRSGTS